MELSNLTEKLSRYEFGEKDTLAGVALKFNMSLSTLRQLNRLPFNARVHPGQILLVRSGKSERPSSPRGVSGSSPSLEGARAPSPAPSTSPAPFSEADIQSRIQSATRERRRNPLLWDLREKFDRQYMPDDRALEAANDESMQYWKEKVEAYDVVLPFQKALNLSRPSSPLGSRSSSIDLSLPSPRGSIDDPSRLSSSPSSPRSPRGAHRRVSFGKIVVDKSEEEETYSFPMSFLVGKRAVSGTFSFTPLQIVFDPSPNTREVNKLGLLKCQFSCFNVDVTRAQILDLSISKRIERGLDFPALAMGSKILELFARRTTFGPKLVKVHFAISPDDSAEFNRLLKARLPADVYRPESNGEDSLPEDSDELSEADDMLPDLGSNTFILNEADVKTVSKFLPYRYRYVDWVPLFNTARDGCSMLTFFKKTEDSGPTLLFVETSRGDVFGAFINESWQKSSSFYGSGECFLFSLRPKIAKYPWKEKASASFFVLSNDHELAVGGGAGRFGIWIGDDFQSGSSASCPTFGNEPLSAHAASFSIDYLEVWGFDGYQDD